MSDSQVRTRVYLKEIKDGDSVEDVFLLAEKQLRANRNADLYLLATLRDKSGVMSGLMWNVVEDEMNHINTGDFVRIRGKVQLYQGSLQMILTRIEKVSEESVDQSDFLLTSSVETEKLMQDVREKLLGIAHPGLRAVMESFLVDQTLMDQFAQTPAGIKAHHAYQGGLLEHVANMMEASSRIADLYAGLDLDLLLAGCFLHDLGKVRELSAEASLSYTDEGQLLGHMAIGIEMLNEKIAEAERLSGEPLDPDVGLRLKHMIISHHGSYEFGSARLPMTLEAMALHYIDNLDAKMHEFSRTIEDDPDGSSRWTPFIPRLDRKLYKGE
ncbi:MAG TPA: HD domain-containing protein [Planctomycetaceae bacterium]|nr:HD domain-containing protein [Planctomycetaceae bacterium]